MCLDADSHFASHLIQAADEGVTPTEELAAILLSKLALEPESHAQIARAGAIPVSRNGNSEGGLMKIVATRLSVLVVANRFRSSRKPCRSFPRLMDTGKA